MRSRNLRESWVMKALAPAVVAGLGIFLYAVPFSTVQVRKPEGLVASDSQKPGTWSEVERLISEQKFEEALVGVGQILGSAEKAGNNTDWARALIRRFQLRIALHGYETAVKEFRESAWPDSFPERAALNLFYAQSLVTYYQSYSWEVNQREKIESSGKIDLKKWTRGQIYEEAQKSYRELWRRREMLGKEPVSLLAEYLEANNYPAGIRSTLRDAVSYLYVALLADSSFWRPEQSNELYRLDLNSLLSGATEETEAVPSKLESDAHPVIKIRMILSDLEAWHVANGRREAALEARLELLRRLNGAFTSHYDREAIGAALKGVLPQYRDVAWWATGMATLAEFVRGEDRPGKLIRARELAQEGYKAYPSSIGGERCLSILKQIEAPDFQIASMSVDGMGKRSVEVSHQNLPALYFRAYAVDLDERLRKAQTYNLLLGPEEVKGLLKSGKPVAEWQADLPPTPDYETHRTYVTPPLRSNGVYAILASAKKSFSERQENRILSVQLVISGMVLATQWDRDSGLSVRVLSGETGRPVAGVTLSLYQFDYRAGHQKLRDASSDQEGRARFPMSQKDEGMNYFLLARNGADAALWISYLRYYGEPRSENQAASLIYTDRSIYRPKQKVFWKVLAYKPQPGGTSFRTVPSTQVNISLLDPNGQIVDSNLVGTNAFGTAAGEFVIPAGRALGGWSLMSSLNGRTSIQVEEYKRPTFEVTVKDPASPLRLNKPAALDGEVKYYFGLPVVNGTVKWRVARTPVYPWWWGWYGFQGMPSPGSQIVASGVSDLKPDGSFRVSFTPAADERMAKESREITFSYQLSVDVTDEGGETRSASRGFRLGFVSVEASLDIEAGFFREGAPGAFEIARTDLNSVPRPGKGAYRVVLLKQPEAAQLPADMPPLPAPGAQGERYQTAGDSLRPRWESRFSYQLVMRSWADGAEKAHGNLTHGENGKARLELPKLAAGGYRLYYETTDDFGAPYRCSREFIVAGARTALALPALLVAEKSTAKAGGTARFLALSGIAGQPLYLETWRDGHLAERRQLIARRDSELIEIPVRNEDRGGFSLRLSALRDYQYMEQNASVFVPWDNKQLKVELSIFRDKIRPGAEERWRVTVKGPSGEAVEAGAAEILAYMYDKSLDAFVPHTPPDPLSLFPNRTRVLAYATSLGRAYSMYLVNDLVRLPAYPSLTGDRVRLFEGYSIGGPGRRYYTFGGPPGAGRALMMEAGAPRAAPPPAPAEPARMESMAFDKMEVANARVVGGLAEPKQVEPAAIRSEFSETAFWQPRLLTDSRGSAAIEFKVPDSVTAWNVWIHAVTRDLLSGSTHAESRSFKDLMVRPYLPRFLREGDRAYIKVVTNNATDRPIKGNVTIEITNPETQENLLGQFGLSQADAIKAFAVDGGSGANVVFPITVPPAVGAAAFKVTAASDSAVDGELRALPILPGRMHLSQSRFVALKDKDRREIVFEDLKKGGDSTLVNEQLVVTLDAQLFYSVLSALPYLINYPYECTEQTLNRFLSTGILRSLFDKYPAVAKMAKEMSKRTTVLESWDSADPNRKMALEETPWLMEAKGGKDPETGIANVLNPGIAKAERDAALAKLTKAQTASGGFPWWPGGPPSPYMTLYIMYGFAKASEFGVDVPRDVVQRGWGYLARLVREDYLARMIKDDCCWEFLTFLNYVAGCYPDPSWMGEALSGAERKAILDHCFKHWKQHSPYLKCQLALTLKRMNRSADAGLVFASVMDSAKTTRDEGTFWAPEDRGWLWYNDTIESHAFALRTMMELTPADARKDGLVQWLFLNKKLNHWKSTRATAEVVYSLADYLRREGTLGVREEASIHVDNQTTRFVFEPDRYTGRKNQVVIPGDKVGPEAGTVVVEKEGRGIMFASATWSFSTEKLPETEQGDLLSVSRAYFKRVNTGEEFVLAPLSEGAALAPGDEVEVQLSLRAKHPCEYVHLRDPRAAGLEPQSAVSGYKWDLGIGWYEEVRDSGTNFFFEDLPRGEYTLKYRLRANMAGEFRIGPATLQSMYAPEFSAYSAGNRLSIREAVSK